jgi:putative ABC transport system permease protein
MNATIVEEVAALPGVERADGVVVSRVTVGDGIGRDVNVVGVVPGGLARPDVVEGRPVERTGEVVADRMLGWGVGDDVVVRGTTLRVVGEVDGLTFLGGVPAMIVTVEQAQELGLGGLPLVNTVAVKGEPQGAPEGMAFVTNERARADLARPLENASGSVDFVTILLWIVAAGIVGTIIYLSAIERLRDFAVLKAIGTSTGAIITGLAVQAVVIALVASGIGIVLALLMAPLFPMLVEIEGWSVALLPVLAVAVALLASVAGLRRVLAVDPGLAFGGAR